MKSVARLILVVALSAAFFVIAAEPTATEAKPAEQQPVPPDLQPLQGRWEGVWEGEAAGDKTHERITVTVTGNSFHFYRATNFWFDTTITLPPDTNPKQLHATIKDCPPPQRDSVGQVVGAIFKIEEGTLTIADYAVTEDPPKTFAETKSRYVLKKVQASKKSVEPPVKSKSAGPELLSLGSDDFGSPKR